MGNPSPPPSTLEISLRLCPQEISQVSGNLLAVGDGFLNTFLVLVEHGYNLCNIPLICSPSESSPSSFTKKGRGSLSKMLITKLFLLQGIGGGRVELLQTNFKTFQFSKVVKIKIKYRATYWNIYIFNFFSVSTICNSNLKYPLWFSFLTKFSIPRFTIG